MAVISASFQCTVTALTLGKAFDVSGYVNTYNLQHSRNIQVWPEHLHTNTPAGGYISVYEHVRVVILSWFYDDLSYV